MSTTYTDDQVGQRVLILAPVGRDAFLTRDLLQRKGLVADVAPDMESFCRELKRGVGTMVLAEEAMERHGAEKLIQALDELPAWSDPPLIVLTGRTAEGNTERLTTHLGSHATLTLLERPVRMVTLVASVQSALRTRQRQYQMRDILIERQRAVEERDRFLAILSHELRNPLATIRTLLAVSDEGGAQELGIEEKRVIARQTRHLSRLIDDLLDVSRLTAGKIVLDQSPTDLCEVARHSLDSLQPSIRAHRHVVSVDIPRRPVCVMGDAARLEQVVTNLLNNAIKYTPDDGKIELSLVSESGRVILRVRDNGVGIPRESLSKLFTPFVQVEQSLSRAQGGLGLGLSLVRRLVEMQKGTVTASSDGVGLGSQFTVTFPQCAGGVAVVAKPPPEAMAMQARRVLLVEDNDDARRAMARLLRSWGHEVLAAGDGYRAVELALSSDPEVALVDIGLPGLDGYEVARRIIAAGKRSICLIALTGYGQPDDRDRATAAGFARHLVKPVEPNVLREALQMKSPQ